MRGYFCICMYIPTAAVEMQGQRSLAVSVPKAMVLSVIIDLISCVIAVRLRIVRICKKVWLVDLPFLCIMLDLHLIDGDVLERSTC